MQSTPVAVLPRHVGGLLEAIDAVEVGLGGGMDPGLDFPRAGTPRRDST